MTTTNIGPCGCCGSLNCCNLAEDTELTLTITASGDCTCWEGSFVSSWSNGSIDWSAMQGCPDFVSGGVLLSCQGGDLYLYASYNTNLPTFGAGCIFNNELGTEVTYSCNPLYIEITGGIIEYLGSDCCSGTVTMIITE